MAKRKNSLSNASLALLNAFMLALSAGSPVKLSMETFFTIGAIHGFRRLFCIYDSRISSEYLSTIFPHSASVIFSSALLKSSFDSSSIFTSLNAFFSESFSVLFLEYLTAYFTMLSFAFSKSTADEIFSAWKVSTIESTTFLRTSSASS